MKVSGWLHYSFVSVESSFLFMGFFFSSVPLDLPCCCPRQDLSDALRLSHPLQKEFSHQNKGIDAGQAETLKTIKNTFVRYFMCFYLKCSKK